jgi:hypothetical protein
MTPFTSNGHAPESTRPDPGDQARCPMERLAEQMNYCRRMLWRMDAFAGRNPDGTVSFEITGTIHSISQIDDLISYLMAAKL